MPSPDSTSSTLYCAEDAADLNDGAWLSSRPVPDEYNDDEADSAIADLIASEPRHAPDAQYLTRLRDAAVTARQDSVSWILKANAFHRFCPVTAFLAVIYFDRFLSSHSLPNPSGWPFQLLSVACLSLAAKMEEPRVPMLLELQACDPKYLFEPKTVQRMELRIMACLDWRLRAVTPFDFLHYFASKLPSSSSSSSSSSLTPIFSASSDLILSTTRVTDFLGFTPSTIAAAAVLCAANESSDDDDRSEERLRGGGDTTSFHKSINKEMVRSCHQLMEEYMMDTCPESRRKERRRADPAPPPSPVGVLDAATAACVSCDTRSEPPIDEAEPLPSSKRLRSSAPDVQHR